MTAAAMFSLAFRLGEKDSRSSHLTPVPFFIPLDDFASDGTEQEKLYWTDHRIVEGDDWMVVTSGKA